ncbi:TetR/AcrR family transcriptional regulator [Nordella sp. HKS 07]|uniref:TetR/AcrR family transcriptional regulator n=1 Tax=Nordella sp. HKS 07 TaxID=2712222 RepID=UPI0013E1DC6A|nr:TetR/AcrR family transcriptional regulator [Nordella sp. HKS 07]QIG49003.1 TetR/AcrR family transcriptional regulator [Nordella sp. HKS 07]
MPRSAERTRRQILDAAYELFYRKGFSRVGVDEVAAFAGLTKRTFYYHFTSKDELLGSVLALHSELSLARIRKYEDRYSGSADEIIDVLFSELARWSAKPGWAGAGFTRIVMELADLPGHPARAIAHRHKAAVEAWWASLLENAGISAPLERAREVVLLMEGATALILIHGDRTYAKAACQAAKKLAGESSPTASTCTCRHASSRRSRSSAKRS